MLGADISVQLACFALPCLALLCLGSVADMLNEGCSALTTETGCIEEAVLELQHDVEPRVAAAATALHNRLQAAKQRAKQRALVTT